MKLLVVESPSKAKTINQYLGKDFTVVSSFGHIRALPSEEGSVLPDENFKLIYEVIPRAQKQVDQIIKLYKNCDELYLATDPDREGEAISWHLIEVIKKHKFYDPQKAVKRVVFYEITKNAILEAIKNSRKIDENLVHSQQSRQALDYLVGYNLSPVLWRKVPGSRSAGRVQSVALRLLCERESEIEKFNSQEYWSIEGKFLTASDKPLAMRLTEFEGKKLDKLAIANEVEAKRIEDKLKKQDYKVVAVESKEVIRNPYPPFTTSTLLQDAARRLGYAAKKTSRLAQDLYEGLDIGGKTVGLITYMRTDSVNVSEEAIAQSRNFISSNYGKAYLPAQKKIYKTKTKNAQEAHEAIRPTDVTITPESLKGKISIDHLNLYELIWKRLVASQMNNAIFDAMHIDAASKEGSKFRANGNAIKFDGFLKLYQETSEDETDEGSRILPHVKVGEELDLKEILPEQHFTQPPPRYTEATLVKKLEELGIGRPSTYPSIISILTDRGYADLDKKRFIPSIRGRLVTAFLVHYFSEYVQYDFTAALEDKLDDISNGNRDYKALLKEFWSPFSQKVAEGLKLNPLEVQEALQNDLHFLLFGKQTEDTKCPKCQEGILKLKFGKFGAFLGCSAYPSCNYIKNVGQQETEAEAATDGEAGVITFPKPLGSEGGYDYFLKKGPYGIYVERIKDKEVKRTSLPAGNSPASVTFEIAKSLLALPKVLGKSEEGKDISVGIGRFGPYILHDGKYTSVKNVDILSLNLEDAVQILAEAANRPKRNGGGRFARKTPAEKKPTKIAKKAKKPVAKTTKKKG